MNYFTIVSNIMLISLVLLVIYLRVVNHKDVILNITHLQQTTTVVILP